MTQELPEPIPAVSDSKAGKTPRSYLLTLGLLAIGSGALFLGYGRIWSTTKLTEAGLPSLVVELSGREVQPAGAAMAIVGLAAIAGLIATRRIGRILSGFVLVIVGLLAAFLALRFSLGDRGAIVSTVSERIGSDVDPSIVGASTSTTMWWLAALFGGSCLALAGVITLTRSAHWPTLGSRYERGQESPTQASRPASAWDQLDEGIDPTVEVEPVSGLESGSSAGPGAAAAASTGRISTSPLKEDPQ